jgi:metal-responsive CopG/Arc/MetJ family transcriptional regulator
MEKRLQIDFSEKAYKELEGLQERLDATSKSEVIRDALGLLRWLTDEVVEKKHRILVEKPEEKDLTREVVFNFLERSKDRSKPERRASR